MSKNQGYESPDKKLLSVEIQDINPDKEQERISANSINAAKSLETSLNESHAANSSLVQAEVAVKRIPEVEPVRGSAPEQFPEESAEQGTVIKQDMKIEIPEATKSTTEVVEETDIVH